MNTVVIGPYETGSGNAPLVVAEIGINHNGDMQLAKKMIETAVENGADMVKLQSFIPEKFLTPNLPDYDQIKNLRFSFKQQEELFAFSKKIKAVLFSTPFDSETIDFLDSMDVPAYKIASMDCNNIPLLRHTARKSKPIFLATGMADLEEVQTAVETIRKEGNEQIILFHCLSDYPTDPSDINLGALKMLGKTFRLPVGFSDHSLGLEAAFAAATTGAVVIEKHFTLDRGMKEKFPYSDHGISIEPDELQRLSHYCKILPVIMGKEKKLLTKNEKENRDNYRRGIYAVRDLEKGIILSESDCIPLRPVRGISVAEWDAVIGKRTLRSIKKGEPVEFSFLER